MHPALSAVLIAAALAIPCNTATAQSINMRQTSARATIIGSRNLYDGTFNARGTSSVCGVIPKEMSMTGVANFVIEFPSDALPNAGIQSIAFGSSKLVGKVSQTPAFRLAVTVLTAKGGRPPAYVLNTDSGTPRNSGIATLTKTKAGALTLRVKGQNDMGQTIDLTVNCT